MALSCVRLEANGREDSLSCSLRQLMDQWKPEVRFGGEPPVGVVCKYPIRATRRDSVIILRATSGPPTCSITALLTT